MPATDIQKMCILDCDFKFGADEGVSACNFLYFSRSVNLQLLINSAIDIRLREDETIPYNPGEVQFHLSTLEHLRSISPEGQQHSSSAQREIVYVSTYPKKSEY